jgi:hypothetical protein
MAVVVLSRGCPLGTGRDCCEWHASGMAGESDPGTAWRRWLDRDRRVRSVLGDHCSVGKLSQTARQLSGPVWSRTPPALRSFAIRGRIDRPGTAY